MSRWCQGLMHVPWLIPNYIITSLGAFGPRTALTYSRDVFPFWRIRTCLHAAHRLCPCTNPACIAVAAVLWRGWVGPCSECRRNPILGMPTTLATASASSVSMLHAAALTEAAPFRAADQFPMPMLHAPSSDSILRC